MDFQLGSFLRDLLVIALGAVAIINGRRVYWLFVGIGGAVIGLWLSTWFLSGWSEWLHVALTLILGAVGVFVAFKFEHIALHVAAFVLGGFILQFLLLDAGWIESTGVGDYVTVLVGGIIALAFEMSYSRHSLIVLSSLTGAAMIASILDASPAVDAVIFAGLAALGMLLQSREWIQDENSPVVPLPPESA